MDFDLNDFGRSARFDEVLQLLRSADYSDSYICRRHHLEHAEDFALDRKSRAPLPGLESAADVLLQLFLAGEPSDAESLFGLLGADIVQLLESMGLLKQTAAGDYFSPVSLYPVADLYIASDRWSNPDASEFSEPADIVYPAFIPNTRLFLKHLPERQGARFLDLCAGTGVAALAAARKGAAYAWSGDIADRSTRFAEFNRKLNGINNFQAVTSDIYQNFAELRFDLICAHPPYVPSLQPRWVFFSGGTDGEEITQRIVQGLPNHLEDGGMFYALTMGSDRADAPLEQRIREWLGDRQSEFDIAFLVRKELDPLDFALKAHRDTIRTREESERWKELFSRLRITSLNYGFLCIQRRSSAARTFTIRRRASRLIARTPWEWLLRWETEASGDHLADLLMKTPLHASRRTSFEVLHRLAQGSWNPVSYQLKLQYPFDVECTAQPWMAHLLSLCNGISTGRDVLRILVQNGVFPESIEEKAFAEAISALISGGFIEVDGYRPPAEAE